MKKIIFVFIFNFVPMIKIGITLCFTFCILNSALAQTLSPRVIPASGGYYSAGGKSLSWTLGEPFYKTLQNGNLMLTQGFQQPYILLRILNLKAFIEGLYLGSGRMEAVLYNSLLSLDPTATDSILVELRDAALPDNIVASAYGIVHTNGSGQFLFPSSLMNGSYYLVIHQRNAIETWSKYPVLFDSDVVNFDFTTP